MRNGGPEQIEQGRMVWHCSKCFRVGSEDRIGPTAELHVKRFVADYR